MVKSDVFFLVNQPKLWAVDLPTSKFMLNKVVCFSCLFDFYRTAMSFFWISDLKPKLMYHGVGNFYLINSKKLQIGIGIGKFSIINSEELHIGNIGGTDPWRGIGIGIGKRYEFEIITDRYRYR